MPKSVHAGGAAASAGIQFQNRVAAWFAARVLVEVPPAEGLSALGAYVRCETEQPVDDVMVGLQNGGALYAQVKRSASVRVAEDSALGSAISQFVAQYTTCRSAERGTLPWERPLDPGKDRLLLVVGPRSTRTISVELPRLLARLRGVPSGQPLKSGLRTKSDREQWRTLRAHIETAWKSVEKQKPTDDEIRKLLELVRVQVLDVDEGGSDELIAQDLLASVVRDRSQVGAAWKSLVDLCARLAVNRTGADGSTLLRELGPIAKAPPSLAIDIQALQTFTKKSLERLEDLGQLRIGRQSFKQPRTAASNLVAAAQGSVLLIGEPGAGKSGVLHDFARSQLEHCADVVVIPADTISAISPSGVRLDLGITRDLEDVLAGWPGTSTAYLVIDALDAIRGTAGSRVLRDVISRVLAGCPRWRVVASIRKFDARYSPELQELFAGAPADPDYSDPDPSLRRLKHFALPGFSDDELTALAAASPEIRALLATSNASLRELLHVPFNLRIACELLSVGAPALDLSAITSGPDLLDSYWMHRVLAAPGSDRRETVLRVACRRMLETRQLRAERSLLAEKGDNALEELLRTHVLTEWQPAGSAATERYAITFSHHVLFDYAVSRLIFQRDPGEAIRILIEDPELGLAARPSIAMFFRRHWFASAGRDEFWSAILRFAGSDLTTLAKLVGPAVAAEHAKTAEEMNPLIAEIRRAGDQDGPAIRTLRDVVAAVLDRLSIDLSFAGQVSCWVQVLDQVTESCTRPVAYAVSPLLVELTKDRTRSGLALDALGRVARRVLCVAWEEPARNRHFVARALTAVCGTFASAPVESALLLRRALAPDHVRDYGHEELFWMAQEVEALSPLDPALVAEIYRAAFTSRQSSREETSIGDSQIVSLTSTKRQDYDLALYTLAEACHALIEAAPVEGARVVIAAMDYYIRTEHNADSREREERSFELAGASATIRFDYSEIWDSSDTYSQDEPMKLLAALDSYVRELASNESEAPDLRDLLNVIKLENAWACLWRRMLIWAHDFPNSIGTHVRSLLWTPEILSGRDTTRVAGELLTVLFAKLESEERSRVESAILSLPQATSPDQREGAEYLRDRLLGCLPEGSIVTKEARDTRRALLAAGELPANRPFVSRRFRSGRPYGAREFLKDTGVPVDEPQNRRIQELEEVVSEFASKYLNSRPERAAVAELLARTAPLQSALRSAAADGVHPKQVEHAYTSLINAAAQAAKAERLAQMPAAADELKALLVEASGSEFPRVEDEDAEFSSPGWSPAPRIEAAAGLMDLAFEPELFSEALRDAILKLSRDPVPAVRYQVAQRLGHVLEVDRSLFRGLLEYFVREERTPGVLLAAVSGGLDPLARTDAAMAVPLALSLLHRLRGMPAEKAADALDQCLTVLLMLDVWRGNIEARAAIEATLGDIRETAPEILRVLGHLRDSLTAGPFDPRDPVADGARKRTLAIYEVAVREAASVLRTIDLRSITRDDPQARVVRSCYRIIDSVSHQIFFAAGGGAGETSEVGERERNRLYTESSKVLDLLADAGVPSATHHLLKALELFISSDPAAVFCRISRATVSSQQAGYQFESLAADLSVKLVQRFIADYHYVLRGSAETRKALLDILEVFAKAGWPSARQLTFRLQEMYR